MVVLMNRIFVMLNHWNYLNKNDLKLPENGRINS